MGVINVLPKHMAELIAAGEVVERPSSVVKELCENAIDAKASVITVEIKNGGITYIRITDNGTGILREDVPKVFINHATSKVLTSEDLESIGTLGFRGEAVASIAAVSKVEILTKTNDEINGTSCFVSAGSPPEVDDAGCPNGTTIIVRDLFYNVPARMKFLKKDISEANAVASVVDRLALSHPEISFRFIRDSKQTLFTPGDKNLLSAIRPVFGKDFSNSLLEVDYSVKNVRVKGYISKPLMARASRNLQTFFVNSRFVKTKTATAAIETAYRDSIMVGKFPSCVLDISLDTKLVDVNVHPAKIEVRFVNEKDVFDAVFYACKNALQVLDQRADKAKSFENLITPSVKIPSVEQISFNFKAKPAEKATQNIQKPNPIIQTQTKTEQPLSGFREEKSQYITKAVVSNFSKPFENDYKRVELDILVDDEDFADVKPQKTVVEDKKIQPEIVDDYKINNHINDTDNDIDEINYKVIGEVFSTYILVECGDEMFIVDKHAAHERMIYDQLKKDMKIYSQLLLSPISVNLSRDEYEAVLSKLDLLTDFGFVVEDFGGSCVLVRQVPTTMDGENVKSLIEEIAYNFLNGKNEVQLEKNDWLYHSVACRTAIKAGDTTSSYEQEKFIKELLANQDVKYCPHGRPVLVKMTKKELEKRFFRV